jgi:hypothetical protein
MFISLETRHLVWDSNNLFFIFHFSVGLLSFFFLRNNLKKSWPPTSLIVLTNAVGLVVVAQHAPCAAHFFEVKQGNKLRPEVWSPETKELLARCCSQCIVISISGFELLRDLHVKHETWSVKSYLCGCVATAALYLIFSLRTQHEILLQSGNWL